ncbi:agmatinase [Thermodesulfobacteriota bacterium]
MMKWQFLDEDESNFPDKRVSILAVPLERSTSWKGGTAEGPGAIIQASSALESFDDELFIETFKAGIDTKEPLTFTGMCAEEAMVLIREAVSREINLGRLPVILGGEHTVTVPAVAACAAHFPRLNVLQIDAHLDLRDQYQGDSLSHACVMRRIHEMGLPSVQVGIRSFSKEEWGFVQQKQLTPFTMDRIRMEQDWVDKIDACLDRDVYISIDADGLDPSIMPSTGTPEPDGLLWRDVTRLLKKICSSHRIVGFDFVEFSPSNEHHHAAFTAAKLIYRILGYIFGRLPVVK